MGQYNYGYSNENSAKQEFRTADGIVQGSYSYVDGNGIVQTVNYVSDEGGFRVAATNLPVGPGPAAPVQQPLVPAPIVEQQPLVPAILPDNLSPIAVEEPAADKTPEDEVDLRNEDLTLDIRTGADEA